MSCLVLYDIIVLTNCCCFQESGPQFLLQLHIILCTGQTGTTSQKISMIISLVSVEPAIFRCSVVLIYKLELPDGDPEEVDLCSGVFRIHHHLPG